MIFVHFATLFAVIFALSYFLIGLCRNFALKKQMVDIPNFRSSHSIPTPRGGGIGIVSAWIFGLAFLVVFLPQSEKLGLFALLSGLPIAVIGLMDDLFDVSVRSRIAVHACTALFFVYLLRPHLLIFGGEPMLSLMQILGVLLILGSIVWSINLFNFMDGLDGFSSTETCFVFGIGGWFFWVQGAEWLAYASWLLVAANLGFFAWNRPRARIFLGDVGSGYIGFLVAGFAILGHVFYEIPAVLWIMLYGAFLVDATVTLLRRMSRKEKWYSAHRSHAYQRLHHSARWSHKKVLIGLFGINSILASLALVGFHRQDDLVILAGAGAAFLLLIYLAIERIAPMQRS